MSCRTYDHTGSKDTYGLVSDLNAVTHSYTVQVHISKSGHLGNRVFLVLQEQTDAFGPVVKKAVDTAVEKAGNVVVRCSKSGKVNNAILLD